MHSQEEMEEAGISCTQLTPQTASAMIRQLLETEERLRVALKPFADYASLPSFNLLPDDHVMTAGSRMAARQITAKDFKAVKEALK